MSTDSIKLAGPYLWMEMREPRDATPRGGGLRDERDTVKILVTGRGALFARGPLTVPGCSLLFYSIFVILLLFFCGKGRG